MKVFAGLFSFKSLMVLTLTIRFMILKVNFCIWCEEGVYFHSLAGGSPVVLAPYVERLFFLHWIILAPCQNSFDQKGEVPASQLYLIALYV